MSMIVEPNAGWDAALQNGHKASLRRDSKALETLRPHPTAHWATPRSAATRSAPVLLGPDWSDPDLAVEARSRHVNAPSAGAATSTATADAGIGLRRPWRRLNRDPTSAGSPPAASQPALTPPGAAVRNPSSGARTPPVTGGAPVSGGAPLTGPHHSGTHHSTGTRHPLEAVTRPAPIALLTVARPRRDHALWHVITYAIGSTNVPWIGWGKRYSAPEIIFPTPR